MDKNQSVEIKFVGKNRTIFNVVSYEQFEKVYKPAGWVLGNNEVIVDNSNKEIDSSKPEEVIVADLKTTDEQTIKKVESMKKASTEKKFNDKIIKE